MLKSIVLLCAFCVNPFHTEANAVQSPAEAAAPTDVKSFAQIKTQGLDNACYPDAEHYLAEYLYQHPQACLWELDTQKQTIGTVPIPAIPADAVMLPPPSGADDTKALQRIINKNEGGAVYGSGTYQVNSLKIRVSVDIFNMPMVPTAEAITVVVINAPDVRIFNSPIDAQGSALTSVGFNVKQGADRFVLINSGFSNIHHTNNHNASGVVIKGVNDFHIACNTFENIINETSAKETTARANAIWMHGSKKQTTSGGIIANNTTRELQSNGMLFDAEFFTIQNFSATDPAKPVRIYANRNHNAGKRLTKLQESNALVLSNEYLWADKHGPLGRRLLFSMINVQFSDNIIARNNRLKVAADGRFDYIFHTNAKWPEVVQDNIHFDCNDIEIQQKIKASSGNISHIITARNDSLPSDTTGKEATNSSANHNVVHGNGSVSFHYWFGPGYENDGGTFEAIGNVIKVPSALKDYKVH